MGLCTTTVGCDAAVGCDAVLLIFAHVPTTAVLGDCLYGCIDMNCSTRVVAHCRSHIFGVLAIE